MLNRRSSPSEGRIAVAEAVERLPYWATGLAEEAELAKVVERASEMMSMTGQSGDASNSNPFSPKTGKAERGLLIIAPDTKGGTTLRWVMLLSEIPIARRSAQIKLHNSRKQLLTWGSYVLNYPYEAAARSGRRAWSWHLKQDTERRLTARVTTLTQAAAKAMASGLAEESHRHLESVRAFVEDILSKAVHRGSRRQIAKMMRRCARIWETKAGGSAWPGPDPLSVARASCP
ncbi:MAG: hypothetical protein B7X33_00835 [Lysobacterales bacterium 13-68-4]|jgi:hypothetical protein|nr:MAG: hypothetical protein B7X33_00835 [Xanthomonadales bacterium 13-68-4]